MIGSELRRHRGDYGIDAPYTGLLPLAALGLGSTALAAYHIWRGNSTAARIAFVCGIPEWVTAGLYLHATRRGKFLAWADVLESLDLRGDEQVLDVGCGRGAVTAMVGKLTPRGHVTGLDLWRGEDQLGNSPAVAEANLAAEGVL